MAGARRKRSESSSERVWADVEAKEETPKLRDDAGKLSVLVEMVSTPGASAMVASAALREETVGGLELDEEFQPVPLGGGTLEAAVGLGVAGTPTYVVRAKVDDETAMAELRKRPDVVEVWEDTPIAPYQTCPIPPCDCSPGTPKGTMADVANYLGVSQVWAAGFRGTGMVVGVVDGGITAQGRPVKPGETTRRIPRVIGGWPTADWGT